MRIEICRLHQKLGVTSVFVTHDQVEAMTLADRLVVLNRGRVEQIGAPTMNFLEARVVADGLTIGVRPDKILITDGPLPGGLDFEVELVEELGTGQVFYGSSGEIEMTVMRNGGGENDTPRLGERLFLKLPVSAMHLFDAANGRRIDLPPSRLAAE